MLFTLILSVFRRLSLLIEPTPALEPIRIKERDRKHSGQNRNHR